MTRCIVIRVSHMSRVAAVHSALEPLDALRRRAVRESVGHDAAGAHLLKPVVADRRRPRGSPRRHHPARARRGPPAKRPSADAACPHTPAKQSACSSIATDALLGPGRDDPPLEAQSDSVRGGRSRARSHTPARNRRARRTAATARRRSRGPDRLSDRRDNRTVRSRHRPSHRRIESRRGTARPACADSGCPAARPRCSARRS